MGDYSVVRGIVKHNCVPLTTPFSTCQYFMLIFHVASFGVDNGPLPKVSSARLTPCSPIPHLK